MLDRVGPSAEETIRETAEQWIEAFGAALGINSKRARRTVRLEEPLANLLGISWHFATFSGRAGAGRANCCAGARRRPALPDSASTAPTLDAAPSRGRRPRGDRGDLYASRRPTGRASARSGCSRKRRGFRGQAWTSPPRSISTRSATTRRARDHAVARARFRRAELARAAPGRNRPTGHASPMCWWSAAAMPGSPPRSS